jgi:cysteinyl-tRNA synthetase
VNRGPAGVNLAAFDRVLFALGFQLDALDLPPVDAPAAIVALAAKRWTAKQGKDFAGADALRQELTAAGWNMKDAKDGYSLEPLKK